FALGALLCGIAFEWPAAQAAGSADDTGFMAAWHGTWRGKLENLPLDDHSSVIEVELEIGIGPEINDGCLSWRSTYFEDGDVRKVKDYRFCRFGDRYAFDEGDGLELDTSVFGNTLYSAFRVRDVYLVTRH